MVQVYDGGAQGFDAGFYVPPTPAAVSYLQNTVDRFQQSISPIASGIYHGMIDKITGFDYQKLAYMAQAVYRNVDNMWMDNRIQSLHEIGHLQNAPQVMVRWLMAEPTIRQMYHDGSAEGYGEMYNDIHPNQVGEVHHDYQIVMDGLYQTDEDGADYVTDYFYDSNPSYDPEFDELNINDVANIARSWGHMAAYAKALRDDPTSQWNSQL